jgi:hypothetical protein
MRRLFVLWAMLAIAWPGWAWGSDTLGFQGTTTAGHYLVQDAFMYNSSGGTPANNRRNFGGDAISGTGLDVGTTGHVVVRFDSLHVCASESSLTAAMVDSGKIWLYSRTSAASTESTVHIYNVTQSWVEGTGVGGTTDTIGVSWLYRDSASATLWSPAGGATGTVTNESTYVTGIGQYFGFKVSKATCSTWVATPSINYGVLFAKTSASDRVFNSSEGVSGERPRFTMYFNRSGGASSALVIGGSVVIGGNVVIGGK